MDNVGPCDCKDADGQCHCPGMAGEACTCVAADCTCECKTGAPPSVDTTDEKVM